MTNANNNPDSDPENHYNEFNPGTWTDAIYNSGIERPSSDSPYLNQSDIEAIFDNSGSSDEFDKDAVDEAIVGIRKRLMRLLYDIAVLSYGGHLDDIDKMWSYLEDSPSYMNLALRNTIERDTTTEDQEYYFDLGFNTGLAFSEITGTYNEDERGSKFLDGFIDAYSTETFRDPYRLNESPSHKIKFTDEIETPPEKVANRTDDLAQMNQLDTDQVTTSNEVFIRHNISPTEYLHREVSYHKVALDSDESMPDLSIGKATERFLEKATSSWFDRCCEIRRLLDEEWESIDDAAVPGPDLYKVLEVLWNMDTEQNINNITSRKICKKFDGKTTYKKSVTQILNRLSEDGKNPSKNAETTFKHGEIVSFDSNNEWWELTDYGRLLFYHVFEQDQKPQWIQIASRQNEVVAKQFIPWTDRQVQILEKGVKDYFDE